MTAETKKQKNTLCILGVVMLTVSYKTVQFVWPCRKDQLGFYWLTSKLSY